MSGKHGIANLKIIFGLVIEVANVGYKIVTDKGTNIFKRIGYAFQLSDEAASLLKINFTELRAEIAELDEADRLDFDNFVKDKFHIADGDLEDKIEHALSLMEAVVELGESVIDFVKNLKG